MLDLHKEGEYRINLTKETILPKINLYKKPEVKKEDYFKGKTNINSQDYFGINLSSFIEDPTLLRNWKIWNRNATGNYLSKFNETTQKQVATLFTNQVRYSSRLTELMYNKLLDNVIRLSYPGYEPTFDKSVSRDITLYISGLVKTLLDQNNNILCMRTVRERFFDHESGKVYDYVAQPIKLSTLKNCKNNDIYIYVPFVTKDTSNFSNPEIVVYGAIRERNDGVFNVTQNIFW